LIIEGAPLKEDAGQEDYDLGLQLFSLDGILTAGTSDASIVTIGSPEWQLRESHSLKCNIQKIPGHQLIVTYKKYLHEQFSVTYKKYLVTS
jgi:hypothetical protein